MLSRWYVISELPGPLNAYSTRKVESRGYLFSKHALQFALHKSISEALSHAKYGEPVRYFYLDNNIRNIQEIRKRTNFQENLM